MDFGLPGYADVLRRLDDAGACRLGFTAMTELAYEPSGYNAVSPYPRNPWNLHFITGGSSSGSAVAVASGAAVIALGSDTGGSVRIPSHCCGVTGWKPTWGAVSVAGALPLAPFLDCVGIFARSAADLAPAAALLAAQARPQAPIRKGCCHGRRPGWRGTPASSGLPRWHRCHADLRVAVSSVAGLPALEVIDTQALLVMQGEAARIHASRLDHPAISPVLGKRLAKGLTIDDATLTASRASRPRLAKDFADQILGDADAVILTGDGHPHTAAGRSRSGIAVIQRPALIRAQPILPFRQYVGIPRDRHPGGVRRPRLASRAADCRTPGRDLDLIALAARVQKITDWHARVPAGICDLLGSNKELFA